MIFHEDALWAALNKYWRPISRHEWIWGLSDRDIHNAIKITWNEDTPIFREVYNKIWEKSGAVERIY